MGILIEQYRSRISSHDNFVKTKDTLSHWKNHFLSLMFMMVFYNAYIPLLIRQANDVEENPGPTIGRTQNAEPYSMEYPMEYLKWSTPKNHVLVK